MKYLRKIGIVLLTAGIILGVMLIVFLVTDLPLDFYWLGFQVSLVFVAFLCGSLSYSVRQEESTKRKLAQIEEEKAQMAIQIKREKEEIQSYFLTWIHQMKTPITALKMIAEETTSSEEEARRLVAIRKELHQIDTYSNMSMSYLKLLETGKDLYISSIQLDRVIRPLIKKYSLFFIHQHLKLKYEFISDEVISDGQWLSILLEQFLSNAIKYTDSGTISISFQKKSACLKITDSGVGISKEDLPRVFERGYAGFNGQLNQKSSGLGLFLAQQIAERLSIRLQIESKVGKGTIVSLYFPS